MKIVVRPDRLQAALTSNANVLGVATIFALAAACLSYIPILLGIVLEIAFLLSLSVDTPKSTETRSVSQSEQVASVPAADTIVMETASEPPEDLSADAVLPVLSPEMRVQYSRLEHDIFQIQAQRDRTNPNSDVLCEKLDYLMGKFLLFALRECQIRDHLLILVKETRDTKLFVGGLPDEATMPNVGSDASLAKLPEGEWRMLCRFVQDRYDHELRFIANQRALLQDEAAIERLDDRGRVLTRRKKYVSKIATIFTNLHYELQLLVTRFESVKNEISERAPEKLLVDIHAVVLEADSMTRTLDQLEPFRDIIQEPLRREKPTL